MGGILTLDDGSTDGSTQIVRVDRPGQIQDEAGDRPLLVKAALQEGAH